jgi:hypothetical protein
MKNTIWIIMIVNWMIVSGCDTLQVRPYTVTSVNDYLAYIDRLNELDAEGLSEEHDRASVDYAEDPHPDRQLYLALVLAQPDYPESDSQAAHQHLSALEDNEIISLSVKRLVRLNLAELKRRQEFRDTIESQARRISELRSKLDKTEARFQTQSDTKEYLREELSDMESRVLELTNIERELRRELDEVKAKLRALTDIEQELSRPDQ